MLGTGALRVEEHLTHSGGNGGKPPLKSRLRSLGRMKRTGAGSRVCVFRGESSRAGNWWSCPMWQGRDGSGRRWLKAGMPEMRSKAQKDFGLDPEGFRKPWKDIK